MPEEPEIWGSELDPPRRVRWRRKGRDGRQQDDPARAADGERETIEPQEARAAQRFGRRAPADQEGPRPIA